MSGVAFAASSVFNAFAFAGASWIMSKIDHKDYVKEVRRHDLALEQLQQQRDRWNQSRLQELDRLQQLHYQEHESREDIEETNTLFQTVKTKFELSKPTLQEFYKPSPKMQKYMHLFQLAIMVPSAYALLV